MSIQVEKATRKQAKLRLGLTGPSGAGKTMSALLIAFGIGPKVLVADTENRSASLYADMEEGPLAGREFDVTLIEQPYTVQKYIDVIDYAEKQAYDVLILDTISHAWAGSGGLLDQKAVLDSRGKGSGYTNWAPITKKHEEFIARILRCKTHLICTMRSKQDYVLEQSKDGKQIPKKVGMAPVQREGMEYEFTAVLDLAMDHSAVPSKHRTGKLLSEDPFVPTIETGELFKTWLEKGVPDTPLEKKKAEPAKPCTEDQMLEIAEVAKEIQRLTKKDDMAMMSAIQTHIKKVFKVDIGSIQELSEEMAQNAIKTLYDWKEIYRKKSFQEMADKTKGGEDAEGTDEASESPH